MQSPHALQLSFARLMKSSRYSLEVFHASHMDSMGMFHASSPSAPDALGATSGKAGARSHMFASVRVRKAPLEIEFQTSPFPAKPHCPLEISVRWKARPPAKTHCLRSESAVAASAANYFRSTAKVELLPPRTRVQSVSFARRALLLRTDSALTPLNAQRNRETCPLMVAFARAQQNPSKRFQTNFFPLQPDPAQLDIADML